MDSTLLLALAIALSVAVMAGLLIRRRQRAEATAPAESQFAVSTEGMKICPKCGMGNLWTDRACISCHGPLRG